MKFNKEMLKRSSTYANMISLFIAGAMTSFPEFIPSQYVPKVMLVAGIVIAACQAYTKGVSNVIAEED